MIQETLPEKAKRAVRTAAPVVAAVGLLASGCVQTNYVEFPKCEIDPQPHSASASLKTDTFVYLFNREVSIEGTILRPFKKTPQEVEIVQQKPTTVTLAGKDHILFTGAISGRNIDVKFSPPEETIGDIKIKVDINTTCDSKK